MNKKATIVKIGTFMASGQPTGWEFRGPVIGLEIRRGLPTLYAGYTLEELQTIVSAERGIPVNVFHKLSPEACDRLHIGVRLERDIEVTTFGEDGRDTTFKGKAGDYLVLEQVDDEYWNLIDVSAPDDFKDVYTPIGS